jgi:hypothetical protein
VRAHDYALTRNVVFVDHFNLYCHILHESRPLVRMTELRGS